MLVVSRSPSCSGSSTIASTYGSSGPGIHGWWLIENVCTVARPDIGLDARFFDVALRASTASAGARSSRQSWQRRNRSSPSAPPVQNVPVAVGDARAGSGTGRRRSSSSSSGFGRGVEAGAGVRDRLDRRQQAERRAA